MNQLFWLDFHNPDTPKEYLGTAIVRAEDFITAVRKAHYLGINPCGQVHWIDLDHPERIPRKFIERLLDRREVSKLLEIIGPGTRQHGNVKLLPKSRKRSRSYSLRLVQNRMAPPA
jgi:hypothetical protein